MQFESYTLNEGSVIIKSKKDNSEIINKIFGKLLLLHNFMTHKASVDEIDYDIYIQLIELLLTQLLNSPKKDKRNYFNQIVNFIKIFLQKNISRKIDFDILSEQLGYSTNRVRVIFKDITGESIYQYLIGIRLALAKKLLLETNMKIGAIGRKCGFKSKERFSLFFTEKIKMSPSQFRKVIKGIADRPIAYNVDSKKEVADK